MSAPDELPPNMAIVRVAARANAPELMADGPHRTAGRPYIAPSPPDELHIVWRTKRRAFRLMMTGLYLLMCGGIAAGGHVIPALVMAAPALYVAAAQALNRRRLVLAERRITLRHEPVPWPGNRTISIGTIEEVFVFGPPPPSFVVDLFAMSRSEPEWSLTVTDEGRSRTLYASGDKEQVYALQRVIEDHLRLREPEPESELESEP